MLEAYSICSSGVKMNCDVLPSCFTSPLTVSLMNRFMGSGTKARGTRQGPIGAKLSWPLAAEPIRAQGRPIGADLQIAAGDIIGGHEARDMVERVFGLDALAAFADGQRDFRLPVDLCHAARDCDVVESAGETARCLEKQIRHRGRFFAGENRSARRRHAGADHLVDVFLKILRGIEHLAGPANRRQHLERGKLRRAAFRDAFLLQEGDHFLQHGEIPVPLLEEAEHAAACAQLALAPGRAKSVVCGFQIYGVIAENDGNECVAIALGQSRELERGPVHRGLMAAASLLGVGIGIDQVAGLVLFRPDDHLVARIPELIE